MNTKLQEAKAAHLEAIARAFYTAYAYDTDCFKIIQKSEIDLEADYALLEATKV